MQELTPELLARALRDRVIRPHYQPIMDLADGRVVALEALARWPGSPYGPVDFVPLAERAGLVGELDALVIEAALDDLARWTPTRPDLRLSLNVSGIHLERDRWVDGILERADRSGVDPRRVDLELTETARPHRSPLMAAQVRYAREQGFAVWFDDFGSGWSALQDLMSMAVDGLKLDRTFAAALGTRVADAIVGAVSGAAAELGLALVVEGIETPAQRDRARALRCPLGQGFLWSAAVPADEVDALLRRLTPTPD